MKINKISINNFKVFTALKIDFASADAVVFDGPNGFGKTSIYDAIELLFTGRIRRYVDLKQKLIDERQNFSENPLLNEQAAIHNNGISIVVEFTKDGVKWVLERAAEFNDINYKIDFAAFKLYVKPNFDSEERQYVTNEEKFLEGILGTSYSKNFQFLNYIEQEECLFLLKHTDKRRKEYISHLFDLKEFEEKIRTMTLLKAKSDQLCSADKKSELERLNSEIIELGSTEVVGQSAFVSLFPGKDLDWDKEGTEIKKIDYLAITGPDGILERLEKITLKKEFVLQYQKNKAADYLLDNIESLRRFVKFYLFILRKDEFRQNKIEFSALKLLVQDLDNFSISSLNREFEINSHPFISKELKDEFFLQKAALQNDVQQLGSLDAVYSDITMAQNLLLQKLTILKQTNNLGDGHCLLCGYDWGTIDNLIIEIEKKSVSIRSSNSERSNSFNDSFKYFKTQVIEKLISEVNARISQLDYDPVFVDDLLQIEFIDFNNLIKSLEFLNIDYQKFLLPTPSSGNEDIIGRFKEEVQSHKSEIDELFLQPYISEYLRTYFDSDANKISQLSVDEIDAKRKYLSRLWFNSQNSLLHAKLAEQREKRNKYENAESISKQLQALKNQYQNSLKNFQKNIIKDIEIIFYVYSGRIMQSFQGGAGLFIYSDKDGIRFQSNPRKTYDAVFSMSAGQLSALVIAFTLALHKKYSQNRLILIDDPVQTMDELNMYGFIDLLRNEFGDNQIIMSTHEDLMSAFMRYKFKNYNLKEKRIDLKNRIQIAAQ